MSTEGRKGCLESGEKQEVQDARDLGVWGRGEIKSNLQQASSAWKGQWSGFQKGSLCL